jgi:hypothetical protein
MEYPEIGRYNPEIALILNQNQIQMQIYVSRTSSRWLLENESTTYPAGEDTCNP